METMTLESVAKTSSQSSGSASQSSSQPSSSAESPVGGRVVAFGASAGGLQALSLILAALPPDFPAPLVLVQHLSPDFPSGLATILGRRTRLCVKEAEDGDRLQAGHVYVAPPGKHLLVNPDSTLSLSGGEKVKHCRPSVDVLFQSVAASVGARAVGVVLTGGDGDGAAGIRAVKAAGGITLAQDQPSSLQPSMPRSAVETGDVDFVLPLGEIAPAILRIIRPGPGGLDSPALSVPEQFARLQAQADVTPDLPGLLDEALSLLAVYAESLGAARADGGPALPDGGPARPGTNNERDPPCLSHRSGLTLPSLLPRRTSPRRTERHAPTTPVRPALWERMTEELNAQAAALSTAAEALRLQNDVLAKLTRDVKAERQCYLDLFGMLPDACLVTDSFGVIIEANPAAFRLLRSSRRWLLGRAILEHIFPEEREAFRRDILGRAEDVQDVRVRLKAYRGLPFEASVTVALVSGPNGTGSGRRWLIRPPDDRAAGRKAQGGIVTTLQGH